MGGAAPKSRAASASVGKVRKGGGGSRSSRGKDEVTQVSVNVGCVCVCASVRVQVQVFVMSRFLDLCQGSTRRVHRERDVRHVWLKTCVICGVWWV